MATAGLQDGAPSGAVGSSTQQPSANKLDLVSSVQQLLRGVSAKMDVSATPAGEVEEFLAHLETTDKNFNSYELVRMLHGKVEGAVGELIKAKVEEHTSSEGGGSWGEEQEKATRIAEDVLQSKQYNTMLQTFLSELRSAVDEMLAEEKILSRPLSKQEQQYLLSSSRSSTTQYFNLDESAASGMSSFNQTGLMFMSQDQLQSIAESLSEFQSNEVRLEAMRQLLQFPPGDLVSCKNWSSLKDAVSTALMDRNTELADLSLKFHYRMFTSRSSQTSSIVYLSLVDKLVQYFLSQNGGASVTVSMGIDPADDRNIKLLTRFRFLNYIQRELPSYWLRYSESVVVDILQATAVLLSLSYSNPALLGPVHFMALFDPKASWFRKWTHGQSSHSLVVDALRTHPVIHFTAESSRELMSLEEYRNALWKLNNKQRQMLQGILLQVLKFNPVRSRSAKNLTDAIKCSQDSVPSSTSPTTPMDEEGDYYNEKMLQYVHFVHCVSMLERLLLHKKGRELFPVELPGRNDPFSVTDLLLHLLHVMLTLSSFRSGQATPFLLRTKSLQQVQQLCMAEEAEFNPIAILAHVFQELINGNALCQQIFCDESLLSAMVAPLQKYLNSDSSVVKVNEEMLMVLGDLLAVLASTDATRRLILHQPSAANHSSPVVDLIVKFTIQALSSMCSPSQLVSPPVATAWLFVCRQLYKSGDGLLVLEGSGLHKHVAKAWKNLRSSGKSHKGSTIPQKLLHGEAAYYSLEDSLIDNLLNFAGTPKGILLLQQSGLMAQCTQHMYQRYKLKLQVSKCEKFGYGCMVTQLASTVAGISELIDCGFIGMLVEKLWCVLEGQADTDDHRITAPRAHPLDPLDRASHKAVINLLNVLSSFPALRKAIKKSTPTSQSSNYSCVSEIMTHLVLLDSNEKRSQLFNYEEEHLFGLRILSVLVTCLDSILFLESKYHFIDSLFSQQKIGQILDAGDSQNDEQKDVVDLGHKDEFIGILDSCSLERNRILITCYFIGGPNERVLPPHYLSKVDEEYNFPMFTRYPAPAVYQIRPTQCKPVEKEATGGGALWKFLSDSGNTSYGEKWNKDQRSLFKEELKKRRCLSGAVVKQLLKAHESAIRKKNKVAFPTETGKAIPAASSLPPGYNQGIDLAVRYGQYLGQLDSSSSHASNLAGLLKQVAGMWSNQHHSHKHDKSESLNEAFMGFDWLSSTIFLLQNGSVESSLQFLQPYSTTLPSAYLWLPRMQNSIHLPENLVRSGIHPVSAVTAHLVELILQSEVPHVSSAFKMSGYTPSQICHHWVRQCFWNFLDWSEICSYLSTCLVLGIEYQVYFCVSVLKHLEPEILRHTQAQDLLVYLKEEGLTGFHAADWLDFMGDLEEKFGSIVKKSLTDFFH